LVKSPLELEFRMAGLHPRLASKCTESMLLDYRKAGHEIVPSHCDLALVIPGGS
jgi:hypothetical protein